MNRRISMAVAMAGVIAMMATTFGQASVTAAPAASRLTATQAADLHKRVDEVLAAIPGGKQVSPTEIKYDGLNVTIDPFYSEKSFGVNEVFPIPCDSGWFCIIVRDTRFEFYTCQMWNLSNWWGWSQYRNNQTNHAVAKAWDQNWVERFSNTAPSSGLDFVDVGPWFHFKPCGN